MKNLDELKLMKWNEFIEYFDTIIELTMYLNNINRLVINDQVDSLIYGKWLELYSLFKNENELSIFIVNKLNELREEKIR